MVIVLQKKSRVF